MNNGLGRQIAERIRAAAKREGLSVEEYRRAKGFKNTAFYSLLREEDPKSLAVVRQLAAAGILTRELRDKLISSS